MDLTSKETLQVSKFRDKTPCFLFDSNKFLSVSKSLNEAFSKLPIIIAYSVKDMILSENCTESRLSMSP